MQVNELTNGFRNERRISNKSHIFRLFQQYSQHSLDFFFFLSPSFPNFSQSLWIFFQGSNMQSAPLKHTEVQTLRLDFLLNTLLRLMFFLFFLLVQLAEDLCLPFWMPLSLPLFCGNASILFMCVSIRVHVCACIWESLYVCVGVNGLCSPAPSPLGIPLPLTPPLPCFLSPAANYKELGVPH